MAVGAAAGAELKAALEFGVAADGDERGIVALSAELDGGGADAAGARMQQHPFVGDQACFLVQVEVGGGEHLRHRRGFAQGKALGHPQHLAGGHRHRFRVAAAGQQGAELIAGLDPLHALAHFDHFAGALQTEDGACARWRRIGAGRLHQVGAVDSAGRHGDFHLPNADLRLRGIAHH